MGTAGRAPLLRLADVLAAAPHDDDPQNATAWWQDVVAATVAACGADGGVLALRGADGRLAAAASVGRSPRGGWPLGTRPSRRSAALAGAEVRAGGVAMGRLLVRRARGALRDDAATTVSLVAAVLGAWLDAAARTRTRRQGERLHHVGAGLASHLDPTSVAARMVDGVAAVFDVSATLWTATRSAARQVLVAAGPTSGPGRVDADTWARTACARRALAPGITRGPGPSGDGDVVAVALDGDDRDHLVLSPAAAVLDDGDDRERLDDLLGFAAQAHVALRNAHDHAALRHEAVTSAELLRYARAVTRWLDVDAVYARTARLVEQVTGGTELALLEVGSDRVRVVAGGPGADEVTVPLEGPLRELAGRVGVDGTVRIDDATGEPALAGVVPPAVRSLLVAGHVENGRLSFALVVAGERPFGADDERFVRDLVELAASAVRSSRLLAATRREAERDDLTGLRNRAAFWQELRAGVAAATPATPFALAVVDVDDFKQVNDRFGHPVGDQVLVSVADRLGRSLRETDHVYRVGGEEFALLVPGADESAALRALRRGLARVKRGRADLPLVTVSCGLAVARGEVDADALYQLADEALYRAKRAGKDRVELAYPSERSTASTRARSGASTTTA